MSEKTLKLACNDCGTTFGAARMPLPITKMLAISETAVCPNCGCTKLGMDASAGPPDIPLPPHDRADGIHG